MARVQCRIRAKSTGRGLLLGPKTDKRCYEHRAADSPGADGFAASCQCVEFLSTLSPQPAVQGLSFFWAGPCKWSHK